MNKKKKKFDPYEPFFCYIGSEPIFEGELYGLSHDKAKKFAEEEAQFFESEE